MLTALRRMQGPVLMEQPIEGLQQHQRQGARDGEQPIEGLQRPYSRLFEWLIVRHILQR